MASRRAVIVSTARTGLTKSFRGGLNDAHGAAMAGTAIQAAIAKAGILPADVEDVILGCGFPEGATGMNVARNAALWAGCPVTTSGTTINRFCSSGLQAVACEDEEAPTTAGSTSREQGGALPCSNFRLDLVGAFATCRCGHPRIAHSAGGAAA